MTIESAIVFVIALIIAWVKPGPGQAAVITRSLNDGFFAGFCVAVGIVLGCAIYFIAVAFGFAVIAQYADRLGYIFKLMGAVYLFYIGYQGLMNIDSGVWQGRKDTKTVKEITKNFTTGLLITLSNPITIFFFIGLLPTIVPLEDLTLTDIFILLALLIYFGLLVDTIIAAMASQVRTTLSDTKIVRKINLITSIGFFLIGAFLFYSALTNFDGAFNIY